MAIWKTSTVQTAQGEPVRLEVHVRDNDPSRLSEVIWDNPRHTIQAFKYWLWDDQGTLVYEVVFSSRNGRQNIPGNRQLTEYTDEHGSYYDIPPGWSDRFSSV